jgi:hypothetical protein
MFIVIYYVHGLCRSWVWVRVARIMLARRAATTGTIMDMAFKTNKTGRPTSMKTANSMTEQVE